MTSNRNDFGALTVGAPVYTLDGDKLGTIKEVQGGFFKVSASMQPDYWLSASTIEARSGDGFCLNFDKDRLGDYKADSPDVAAAETRRLPTGADRDDQMTRLTGSETQRNQFTTDPRELSYAGRAPTAAPEAGITREVNDTERQRAATAASTWDAEAANFRHDFESRYGTRRAWEEYEPGYRYGFEMASDERYRNRNFDAAESDLAGGYESWARNRGYPSGSWERMRESARQAFEDARARRSSGGNGSASGGDRGD